MLGESVKGAVAERKEKGISSYHDLTFFMKRLNLPEKFENICKDLSSAYAETRYPTDVIPSERFSKADADEFLEKTKEVLEWIQKRI